MSFSATTGWDVRSSGATDNGGGFDLASAGTNFAIQDAPQVTYTDLVIDASTNTKITSSGNPFTSVHVGNVINITSGTGFTVQRVQVVSVAAGVATCDKAVGTTSSTGGHGKLGGGLTLITDAQTLSVAGNSINIKNATYTLTTGLTVPNSQMSYIGYGSTWSDLGTRPLITTATNSINIFTDVANGVTDVVINNISLSSTASTRGWGIVAISRNWTSLAVLNCKLDGFKVGIYGDDGVDTFYFDWCEVLNTEITNSSVAAIQASVNAIGCYIHGNSGDGWKLSHATNTGQDTVFSQCIISTNGGKGINMAAIGTDGGLLVESCTVYNNTSDGVLCAGTLGTGRIGFINTIFYSNGGYGLNISSATATVQPGINQNNAYGANTTAARNGVVAGPGDVTLSGNPFTNAGSGDFSLNSTAGAGAACKAAGFPGAIGGSASTGSVDIGAIQSGSSGGSSGMLYVPNLEAT